MKEKQAAESLRESERKLRLILENTEDTIFAYNMDRQLLYVNPAFEQLTGYTTKELSEQNFTDYIHPDDETRMMKLWENLFKGSTFLGEEFRIVTKNGKTKWCSSSWKPLLDEEGRQIGIQGRETDITGRKKAEEEIAALAKFPGENPNPVLRISIDGTVLYCNKASSSLLNTWQYQEGQPIADKWHQIIQKVLDSGVSRQAEVECGDRILSLSFAPVVESHYVNIYTLDITERKKLEDELKESEEKFRQMAENINQVFWIGTPDWNEIYYISPAYEEVWGRSCQSLYESPRSWLESIEPEDRERVADAINKKSSGDLSDTKFPEYRIVHPDGSIRWILAHAFPLRNERGEVHRIAGIAEDITERKRGEEKIKQQNEYLNNVIESLSHPFYVIDARDYKITMANSASGIAEISEGITCYALIHDRSKPCSGEHPCPLENVKKTGKPTVMEHIHFDKSGNRRFFEIRGYPIFDNKGNVLQMIEYNLDITERKKVEEELKKISSEQQIILDSVQATIWYKDTKNNVVRINKASAEYVGMKKEEIEGKSAYDLFPDEAEKYFKDDLEVINSGEPKLGIIEQMQIATGEKRWVRTDKVPYRNEDGEVIGIIAFIIDITEQRRMEDAIRESEEKLVQSQKMEAVGRLAGGIAHDFNNLLTTILGYSDIILSQQGLDNDLFESAKEINASAKRAATLTQQLLAFSRKQVLQPKVIDLNKLITNLSKMLRRLIGEDIDLMIKLDSDLGQTRADPGQVEQVIMNLAVNARDAMPKGGTLTLETQNVVLDESYSQQHPEIKSGNHVLLAVSDTGQGMDEEIQEHIFEPFFTTKGVGKGTGLGLSTVFGIVKQSEGHISVTSEPGKGTSFKIYLPRLEEVEKKHEMLSQNQAVKGGTETVLLVEDEAALRKMAGKILKRHGYRIIEASNGMEARERTDELGESKLDLLITDVIMPGMSGEDLADMLHEKYPDLSVLYISGYTNNIIAHHGILHEGVSFLQKPFSPKFLAKKVREVLDEKVLPSNNGMDTIL